MGMRKEFADMTERDILFKLNEDYPDQSFDVVLKCWEITDRTSAYSKHCGQHTQIMRECIQSCAFQKLMIECGSRAELEWACGQTHIRVMCICENGRHKSVAVATALQAVYLKMGFISLGPCHMSEHESGSETWQIYKDVEEQITLLEVYYRRSDAYSCGDEGPPVSMIMCEPPAQ